MNVFQLLKEPVFANDLERDYTLNSMSRREYITETAFLCAASVAWVPPLLASEFGFIGSPEHLVLVGYSLVQAIAAICLLLRRPPSKVVQRFIFSMLLLGQVAWTVGALIDLRDGKGSAVLAGIWIGYMFLGNLLMPLRSWAHNVIAAVSLPSACYAFWYYQNPDIGIVLTIFSLLLGQNAQIFSQRILKLDAIRTFRAKSKYIPRQVLMNAVQNDVSILNVFSPTDRFCVCICSDWTNLSQATRNVPLSAIGKSLGAYYDQVVSLLSRNFPDGRFFVDWIADELFIVVFADDDRPDSNMVKQGFDFCVKMLDFRTDFERAHGFPKAIQIGLTAGTASVGVFGNGGIAKATAFGATPGNARRLQQLGKKIDRMNRTSDRIVMNEDFAGLLGLVRTTFSPVTLGGYLSVKDLQTNRVYVWPPIDQPKSLRSSHEGVELRHLLKVR